MPRTSGTWLPGMKALNPGGKTLPERMAARTIAEAFRSLADPVDIGKSLLAIFAGVDPFEERKPNPDGMPEPARVPIDMTHRLAALKLYVEYGYGKPLQGVIVDAQVRQETRVIEERTHVVELRELASRDPAAREALRVIARAALSPAVARDAERVGPLADGQVHPAPELLSQVPAHLEGAPVVDAEDLGDHRVGGAPAQELDDDELPGDEALADAVDDGEELGGEVGDLHDSIVEALAAAVKGENKQTVRVPGLVL